MARLLFSPLLPFRLSSLTKITDINFGLPYDVQYRPPSEFSYDLGRKKLAGLDLYRNYSGNVTFVTPGGETEGFEIAEDRAAIGFTESQGKLLKASAAIDMNSRSSVGCAGAVISYLGRHSIMNILPGTADTTISYGIKIFQMFSIQDMMYVSRLLR